ncbi:MAG: histidine kinase [Saprospiraceae bacterium]|nr:histidine kinase [Saprospiraceae bacterium]
MLFFGKVFGQGNTVIDYSSKDGLCNYLSHELIRDHLGRIWVASGDGGVSVYDGNGWMCYNINNGLASDLCTGMVEDKFNNIWVYHTNKIISRIKDNKVNIFQIDKNIDYIYLNDDRTLSIFSSDSVQYYTGRFDYRQGRVLQWKSLSQKQYNWIRASNNNAICSPKKGSNMPWMVMRNGDFEQISTQPENNSNHVDQLFINYKKDIKLVIRQNPSKDILLYLGKTKKRIKPEYVYTQYGSPTKIQVDYLLMRLDQIHNRLFIIWKIGKNDFLLQDYSTTDARLMNTLRFQTKYEPQTVTMDAAGNYWIGTERLVQKILCYQYTIPLETKGFPNIPWVIQQSREGNLWIGSYGHGFTIFDGYKLSPPPPVFQPLSNSQIINSSTRTEDGTMLFNIHGSLQNTTYSVLAIKNKRFQVARRNVTGIYLDKDGKGRLLFGTFYDGLYIFKNDKSMSDDNIYQVIDKKKGLKLDVVTSALRDKYGRYWMGRGSQGIAMYDGRKDKVINWLIKKDSENVSANSMAEDSRGNLWFGGKFGLHFFKNRPNIDSTLNLARACIQVGKKYFGKLEVYELELVDDTTLLVGFPSGYLLLDLNKFYHDLATSPLRGSFSFESYNYKVGPVEQNSFMRAADGTYWLVTVDGIVSHNPLKYIPTHAPKEVIIDSLKVGSQLFRTFDKEITLGSDQRTLNLYFSAPTDSLLYHNLLYQYKLNDDDWSIPTRDAHLLLQNLNAGKYLLQVRAARDGNFSPIKKISFVILPPLWLRWQVWLTSIIFIMLLGLYLYSRQITIYRQKLRLSQKETEFELMSKEKDMLRVSAIVNQLNPHFINNALQWLQIRTEDVESVRVIGRLAENINTVFRNTRKKISYHSLADELKLTSNYLYIQTKRFGDNLKFEIPNLKEEDEISKVNVPIMIIQIHVENAVEHGIRNNETGEGTVIIRLGEDSGYVFIDIEDDGVGRKEATRLGSKGTQNGTMMLRELENIYNRSNKLHISQTYYDDIFTDATGRAYGTRVVIKIPKNYDYNI